MITIPKKMNFSFIYKTILSISIITAGICFIWGCLNIYLSDKGYSREIVINTFSKIETPVFICIFLILGSFIINIIFKDAYKKTKFYKPKNFNQTADNKLSAKNNLIIKIVVISVGIGLLTFGALTGGFADVLTKAINICTECIGLG